MAMSLDDRLSFGDSNLEGLPPEGEPKGSQGGGGPNRVFLLLAIAMGGLIVLGVLAVVFALMVVVPRQKQQQAAAVTQTVQVMTQVAAAWTPTFTPAPTQQLPTWTPTARPTWTPIPTATATRVLGGTGETPEPTVTATQSILADWGAPSSGTGTKPGATTPPTGIGGVGLGAIAAGLSGLVFAIRKLRSR
jgi:type II secretory pathway pseudopilin PulG